MSKTPKNSTKTAALAAPDKAIRAHGEKLIAAIEADYAAWLRYRDSKAPLDRIWDKISRSPATNEERADRLDAAFIPWRVTRAGLKNGRLFHAYRLTAAEARRLARKILRLKPESTTGFAIYSIAAFYNEGDGYPYNPNKPGLSRVTAALCQASGVRIPKPMRTTLREAA